jgi:hypothetical protein
VAAALEVLLADGLLDPVHLVLVALPVPHGALLRLLQRRLQGLNNFFLTPELPNVYSGFSVR